MQRYILENKELSREDKYHIQKVMRMKTGDRVIICHEGICHLVSLNIDKDVTYDIIETYENKKKYSLTLFQGLPKASKIETTIKYASMFGVDEIVITQMDRSENKYDYVVNKKDRFKTIAKEASELAHRFTSPNIKFIKSIKYMNDDFDIIILADEEALGINIFDLEFNLTNGLKIAIVIGPEGGISDLERSYLKDKGAKIITLGNYILASEIAVLPILSYFLTKWHFFSWKSLKNINFFWQSYVNHI